MERIRYGDTHSGTPDTLGEALHKLESAILDLEDENGELLRRLEVLESRFRIHIRGPSTDSQE